MLEMVEARRTSGEAEQRYDLFSGLLDASQQGLDDGGVLSDEELIGEHSNVVPLRIPQLRLTCRLQLGNTFIFLIAGHEVGLFFCSGRMVVGAISPQTTAHTLGFTLGLLALFPDEQERLYQHIKGVMPDLDGMPVCSRVRHSYKELTPPPFPRRSTRI